MFTLLSGKKVVGIKQTLKAVKNGTAKKVFIARDADAKMVNSILDLCDAKGIEIVFADSMAELGKACQIDVGCAAAAAV